MTAARVRGSSTWSGDGEHGRVERALVEPLHEPVAVLDVLLDAGVRQHRVHRREHQLGQARDRADPAYGVVVGGAGGLERAGQVAEDVVGLPRELRSGRRRSRALGVALEEHQAGTSLQPGEALARRGLGDLETPGGRTDRAGPGHGEHQLQVVGRDYVTHRFIVWSVEINRRLPSVLPSAEHGGMSPRTGALRMLVGIAVTDLTFRTSQVALPLVVLAATGSAGATGLVGGASGIPVLLSPWWARRLRHRVRSGRAVAACYLVEAVALGAVALSASLGRVDVAVLAAAGLLLGAAEAVDGPARDALVADLGDLLGEDHALTLLTTRDFFRRVSMVVGPGLGGLLVARGGSVPLLWVEVASILLSAALAAGVRAVGREGRDEVVDRGIWATVRGRRELLAGWAVRGTGCALWFGFTLGLALLGAESGRGGTFLAAGMTAYGAGSVLGTLGVVRLLRVLPALPAVAGAWALTGGCWVAMGRWPETPVIAGAAFVSGLAVVVGNAGVTAQITRGSDGAERRVLLAGQSVVVNASSSLGLLVGGPLLALVGSTATLTATGAVTAVVALASLTVVRRSGPSGEPAGDLRGPRAVPAAEEGGVHEQRVELVEPDAVAPALTERGDLLVGLEHAR